MLVQSFWLNQLQKIPNLNTEVLCNADKIHTIQGEKNPLR
jgi:hypothetical protein